MPASCWSIFDCIANTNSNALSSFVSATMETPTQCRLGQALLDVHMLSEAQHRLSIACLTWLLLLLSFLPCRRARRTAWAPTGGLQERLTKVNGLMAACMAWALLKAQTALAIREAGLET